MPTYSLDGSFFEEYEIPINESEWTRGPNGEYIGVDPAETVQLDPAQLEASLQTVWSALKSAGATQLRCVYDGGGDEGFAHFESAQIGNQSVSVNDLVTQFSEVGLERTVESSSYPPEYLDYLAEYLNRLSPFERAKDALEFLAYSLAAKLLGKGFGTGVEGSMYGAFHVDLMTGKITDEPTGAPQ